MLDLYISGCDLGFSSTIYQEPHQLHHNAYNSPSFRSADDESLCAGSSVQNMNNFRLAVFVKTWNEPEADLT